MNTVLVLGYIICTPLARNLDVDAKRVCVPQVSVNSLNSVNFRCIEFAVVAYVVVNTCPFELPIHLCSKFGVPNSQSHLVVSVLVISGILDSLFLLIPDVPHSHWRSHRCSFSSQAMAPPDEKMLCLSLGCFFLFL